MIQWLYTYRHVPSMFQTVMLPSVRPDGHPRFFSPSHRFDLFSASGVTALRAPHSAHIVAPGRTGCSVGPVIV